jgi:hypothetical protein
MENHFLPLVSSKDMCKDSTKGNQKSKEKNQPATVKLLKIGYLDVECCRQ